MNNIIKITDLNIPELDIYARLTESQLLHYYEPNGGLFIAESPKVVTRALGAGCEPVSVLVEDKDVKGEAMEALAKCGDIPVYTAPFQVLAQLTGYKLTRGILCAMKRPVLPSMREICRDTRRIVILENVMNPTNVGAIFRSAAALNMDGIILTKGCSDPLYRRSARVSMGTVFQIPWTYVDKEISWPKPGIHILKEMGFKTVAFALRNDSVSIDDPILLSEQKLAVIMGTEGEGLAAETMANCDYTVKIPMSHGVDSLNVAAASAVAFWQLGNK